MLYENQQIGAFTTLISYYLGYHRYRLPFSINTYQQTPKNDTVVGDVLSYIQGKYFIFEFKRSKKDFASESAKGKTKALKKYIDPPLWREISGRGHFISHGETKTVEKDQQSYLKLDFVFYPYWSIVPELDKPPLDFTPINGVESLLQKMMSPEQPIGFSKEEFMMYLQLLKDAAGDETYSTSGTVFCVNAETGEMMNIEFENYIALEQTLNINWNQYQVIRLEQELQQKKQNKPTFKRGFGMG